MKSCRGHALLSVVAILGALLVASVATVRMTRRELHGTAVSVARQKALYIAEAGVQRALARLSQDRASASTSTAYTYSASDQAVGEGTYDVNVVQDPVFPSDASRKRITAVGAALGEQATVVAQAHVQDVVGSATPPICFTAGGKCKIQSLIQLGLPAVDSRVLWSGDIFSNNDAAIETPVGVRVRGSGRIDVVDRFNDGALSIGGFPILGAVLASTNASLYTGVQYTPSGLLGAELHPILSVGLHFANGSNGHGQVQPPTPRAFPQVDWESLRRDPRTIIVNSANVPTGSWDSSGTWVVTTLSPSAIDEDVIYYVEGNVHITTLQLLKGARMTIAARGWSAVEALSVLNLGLIAGSTQDVRIIAEDKNTIGLNLLNYLPTLQDPLNALGAGIGDATGIGLAIASVATTNRLFAYSEKGDVWAKTSTLSALSTTRVSMVAKNDATIAFTGTLNAGVLAYQ